MGMMVGKYDWHQQKMPKESVGAVTGHGRRVGTTLVGIEAALNSRPITQDTVDALYPAHFLCGAKGE